MSGPNYRASTINASKGLIVSSPITVQGNSVLLKSTQLDQQDLRMSLLFWDELVWPLSNLFEFGSSPDELFLEKANVLSRPRYGGAVAGGMGEILANVQASAFRDLDQKEPGKWSVAQGENSLWLKDGFLEVDTGYSLELHRAIPVPDKAVPLAEVLEFRQRRRDELIQLRNKLDDFLLSIELADDKKVALAASLDEIDRACSDAIRVSREWQFPVRLSNFKSSFEARPVATIAASLSGAAAGLALHLSTTTILLAAAGAAASASPSFLKVTADMGWRGLRPRKGPFRYVADYHNELF